MSRATLGWRRWSAEDDATLRVLQGAGLSYPEIGAALDRTAIAVRWRRATLDLVPRRGRTPPAWTEREERRLLLLLERHWSYARISRDLGRSVIAIKDHCSLLGGIRVGATLLTANGTTPTEVARRLGVEQQTVVWWIQQGWLRATVVGTQMGRGVIRIVERADLEAFLGAERFWHLWDPARVVDPVERHRRLAERGGLTFLTTGEVGDRLAMTHEAVNLAIRRGRIRAVRPGLGNWLVRSDWLVLAERRPPSPRRFVTERDGPRIRALWTRIPATEIAARLGCASTHAVVRAARAMGLEPLGRGYWKKRDGSRWTARRAS